MRLKAHVRRQQILAAAARLFSRQGFDGTTTRQIASAVGVNESIIFRHFASKEQLYRAVLSAHLQASTPAGDSQLISGYHSVETALSNLARKLLDRSGQGVALTRLLLFSALRDGELSESLFRNYTADSLRLVSTYIREGMERGWLRKIDPEVGARAFIGMIIYHSLIQELFPGDRHQKPDSRRLGRQLADIWLSGVSARHRYGSRPQRKSPAKAVRNSGTSGFDMARKLGVASVRQTNSAVTVQK